MGDIINNITNILNSGNGQNGEDCGCSDPIGDVTGVVNNVLQSTTSIVHNVLQDTTSVVNNLLQNTFDTLNQTTGDLANLLGGDGTIALNLDENLLSTLGANVGVIVDNSIQGDVNANVAANHVVDLVQQITGLDVPIANTLLNGLGANIGFDLLNGGAGTDNTAGDYDLEINGLGQLGQALSAVSLDGLEGLVGDNKRRCSKNSRKQISLQPVNMAEPASA